MAFHKKEEFGKREQELSLLAKALSHPARIAILKVLAERGACICGAIVEELPLAQSTVSQHLKELRAANLIEGTIDGPRSTYKINWKTLQRFDGALQGLFTRLRTQNEKLYQ